MFEQPKFKIIYSDEVLDFLDTLVITTHGIVKKTQKTPSKEIKRAEIIRTEYFNAKNRK